MPRTGPVRKPVQVKILPEFAEQLDWRANEEGLVTRSGEPNRSELMRIMLDFAAAEMPKGWRPEGWRYSG
ncbi:hypothetical protein CH300_26290 [Rhodococcus sp. 15-1154-1]|nr:hypothetical protein [Rhodococcus sp. 15-1154-1]OZE97691.1 hypothetical protein CH300_26290 [Rhodococcus sp. 15-1154-1]